MELQAKGCGVWFAEEMRPSWSILDTSIFQVPQKDRSFNFLEKQMAPLFLTTYFVTL